MADDLDPILLRRKLRRTLDAVVQGDMGLAEAVVWWMDETTLHLWSPERAKAGSLHRVRVDLGVMGRQIDVQFAVAGSYDRRQAQLTQGYLLTGEYSLTDPRDRPRLLKALRHVNPAVGRDSVSGSVSVTSSVVSRWAGGHGSSFDSRSTKRRKKPRTSRIRAAREADYRTAAPRQAPPIRPIEPPAPPPPAPPVEHTADLSDIVRLSERPKKAPLAQSSVGQGTPPVVCLRYPTRAILRRGVRIYPSYKVALLGQAQPSLQVGSQVVLAVQLPDATFVQLEGTVVRSDSGKLQINCPDVPPLNRSVLRAHLDGG